MNQFKKVLTLFILIITCISAKAQPPENNIADEDNINTKFIKMPKYPIADFPKKSLPISHIEVLQFIRDSVRLGYALKGVANQVAQIQPEKPLTSFLQQHVLKMYKDDFKKGGIKMLWVIKELRIGERINFGQYSYLKLKADSYISSNDDRYNLVYKIDTVFVTKSGGDVTAWHGQEIEDALKIILKESLKKAEDLKNGSADSPLDEITRLAKPEINYPILKDTQYVEGAYKNFEEFIQNKPSIYNYKPQTFYDGKTKFIIGFTDEKEKSITIWGICKKGEIYKFAEKQLVPIEKRGNNFIVSHYIEKSNKRNRGLFLGGLLGGVTGSLISLSLSEKIMSVKSIPYIKKSNQQPNASLIDMETGEFSF